MTTVSANWSTVMSMFESCRFSKGEAATMHAPTAPAIAALVFILDLEAKLKTESLFRGNEPGVTSVG